MSDNDGQITINFQRGAGRPQPLVLAMGATIRDLQTAAGLGAGYSFAEDGEPVNPSEPLKPSRTYTAAENHKGA